MSTRDVLNDSKKDDGFAGKIAGNKQIKEYVDKILAAREKADEKKEELDDLNGKTRSLYNDAKSKGIDTKALKKVVKQMRGEIDSDEHRNTVNAYLNALGEKPLFATPVSH